VLVNRQNKTVRPDTHIPESEQGLSKCRITHDMGRLYSLVSQTSSLFVTTWLLVKRILGCIWILSGITL
jgi:hypothetical protein